MTRSDYHSLDIAAKRAYARDAMREPAVTCPHCEARTPVDDLLTHIAERCEGHRVPHQLSQWICTGAALRLGVPETTLRRWVGTGMVRAKGQRGCRRVLKRDVVQCLALRGRQGCAVDADEHADGPQLEMFDE